MASGWSTFSAPLKVATRLTISTAPSRGRSDDHQPELRTSRVSAGKAISLTGKDALVCGACKLRYAIKDDIPIMLIDEATRID
jgi:uncharacterized protein YbaR (Trm112 family)